MLVGIALTLAIDERAIVARPQSLRAAIVEPFREYVTRRGRAHALLALSFMFFYKLGDSMATALSTPFYIDLGFSLTEIGLIAKNAALWPSIIGGILGGIWMVRIGIDRALWAFGAVQLVTILGFAVLAEAGNDAWLLAVVISLEYLGVGLGTAAFVAFMARETAPALAATQVALFTALAALPRTLANALTGLIVEGERSVEPDTVQAWIFSGLQLFGLPATGLGWTHFFFFCTAMALPGMILLWWIAPLGARSRPPPVPVER
jgi:PAT family beta-lactamase induction signal transducer AmpG